MNKWKQLNMEEYYRCYRCHMLFDKTQINLIHVGGENVDGHLVPKHDKYLCNKCVLMEK